MQVTSVEQIFINYQFCECSEQTECSKTIWIDSLPIEVLFCLECFKLISYKDIPLQDFKK